MKTVKDACKLQSNALEIQVGDQIEKLEELISETDGNDYFAKTFITEGMSVLLTKGMARLAGKSNDSVFHLKQAMGGGKTHLMVGFGLLARNTTLRANQIAEVPHQDGFSEAKVAAFNGRNNPATYIWGEIAKQLGKESLFREYWESGAKAPDEAAWIELFEGDEPILLLLDEMPPYFHYYSTQQLGDGTVADVITRAFANMLTAAQKKSNVCVVVSDLEAAYDTGGRLIQQALNDATQELGRAEVGITPVNLESNEIYEILRKRLFDSMPPKTDIQEIASIYASRLSEAAKAKSVERSAEALVEEIEETYPFHPRFKNLVALFKENESFRQTRGLMELVSRLLKSVWNRADNDVFLIGAQHFDLSLSEVREKLADISKMRDVIARDLWSSDQSAHAQVIDLNSEKNTSTQAGTLLLTASLSTAVNSVKGLSESELLECLIDPFRQPSDFKNAFAELQKSAWYLHQTTDGRHYFDRQENLTKKLQGYADKAPQNKVDELIRHRLDEMYSPTSKEAYEKVLPLPEMEDAEAAAKYGRAMLIISPDGKTPPEVVSRFYEQLINKNNVLILSGDKSRMANIEKSARHVYDVKKTDKEISESHIQRKELEEKRTQYEQDFQATILSVFDKVLFPGQEKNGKDVLRNKPLDSTYTGTYNGEEQVIKTLTSDPIKLYIDIKKNFDALKAKFESLLFGNQDEARVADLKDKIRQKTSMPWIPAKGFEMLLQEAYQRGLWEDLGNGYVTKKPKPKTTSATVMSMNEPDDAGMIRIKIETLNAGNAPRVHYAEDGKASEQSPVLKENILDTTALRVQFLVVDPSGKNLTGGSVAWQRKLLIRNELDEATRKVILSVVPRGIIRYTLDGSEPRNGLEYREPVNIGNAETKIYVYAEADGLEMHDEFAFSAKGEKGVKIKQEKPAMLTSQKFKRLDSSTKAFEGLNIAKEKNIEFEQVALTIGSGSQVISLTLGEIRAKATFIEEILSKLQDLVDPSAPIVLQFKRAHFATGYDLEQFIETLGIELENGEVVQE